MYIIENFWWHHLAKLKKTFFFFFFFDKYLQVVLIFLDYYFL